MRFINNRFWNIINFSISLLTVVALNKIIGFNTTRSSYELTINMSRQILLFSGLNLISGNLIYFVKNNDRSIQIFRQLYLFNSFVILILSLSCYFIFSAFNLFSSEIRYALIIINFILLFDYLGFFAIAIGNVYIQYFCQFLIKLSNILAIILIGFFNYDVSILIFTYSFFAIIIFFISKKINLSPIKIESLKKVFFNLKKIILFSLPWFLASPLLNYFSTYIWLSLNKNDLSITYYSLLLFGTSTVTLLLINPSVDKITYKIRSKISTRKHDIYLILLTFSLVGLSQLLRLDFILENYYFNYILSELLDFDSVFINSYLYIIPIYVAFACPVLIMTRLVHINKRQNSFTIISVIVALLQLVYIYFSNDLNIFDFIKISLLTSFVTYIILVIYNFDIIKKSSFLSYITMYSITFLMFMYF